MERKLSHEEKINLNTFSSIKGVEEYTKVELFPTESEIMQRYFTKRKARVLDIGCGVGRTTLCLYEMGFDVTGIDIAQPMIEKARSKYNNIDFRVGDACNLEFPDQSFDYVLFSFNGIDYIHPEESRIRALGEINRVTKYGGIFVFSTHNPYAFMSRGIRSCIHHWYWLSQFVILNITKRRIFSKYKMERVSYGELITYYINPFKQREQLENNGFELLETVGRFKGRTKYLEPWLYYVALKKRMVN